MATERTIYLVERIIKTPGSPILLRATIEACATRAIARQYVRQLNYETGEYHEVSALLVRQAPPTQRDGDGD